MGVVSFNRYAFVHHNKRLALAFLLALLLSIFLTTQPIVKAQTQATPRIELSKTSGPTGTILVIRGFNQQVVPIINERVGYLMLVDKDRPNLALIFGAVSYGRDGSFTWAGPLPAAGYWSSFEDASRTGAVVPGKTFVTFGVQGLYEGGKVAFDITENSGGPYVNRPDVTFKEKLALWQRTDSLVASGRVSRSWLWGPGFISFLEPYKEAPNGWRAVTYFDKARMEVTDPSRPTANNPYFVTNGLLVREMITGNLQLGDNTFQPIGAAKVVPIGDLVAANRTPTFAAYAPLQTVNNNTQGKVLDQALGYDGQVSTFAAIRAEGITAAYYVKETNHYVASVFWDYLNSNGLIVNAAGNAVQGRIFDPVFAATGLPITEAYYTRALVGGQEVDVWVQMFERRVLTYTPSNPAGFKVEMGNVGLQYYSWRYGG